MCLYSPKHIPLVTDLTPSDPFGSLAMSCSQAGSARATREGTCSTIPFGQHGASFFVLLPLPLPISMLLGHYMLLQAKS